MQIIAVIGLIVGQIMGLPGYTMHPTVDSPDVVLVVPSGSFSIQLGLGCDDLIVGQNVEVLPGSGGVASISSPGSTYLCNVFIGNRLPDIPMEDQ